MAASPIAPPEFGIELEDVAGATVVAVTGELDLVTAPRLAAALDGAVQRAGGMVVDLCDVPFCDSSGLTTLLHARDAVTREGGRFAVACVPDGSVRRVVTVSGAEQVLGVQASRADALRALG